MPRLATRRLLLATLLPLGLGAGAPPIRAQGAANSLDQLSLLVRPGDTVTVTPNEGEPFSGKIAALSPASLSVLVGSDLRTVQERSISTITQRRGDSLANGAALGLAIGAGTGAVACGRCHVAPGLIAAGIYGGIGAGIGVGIDALIRGKAVVYRRPSSTTRVVLTPQLTPSHRGATVSVRW